MQKKTPYLQYMTLLAVLILGVGQFTWNAPKDLTVTQEQVNVDLSGLTNISEQLNDVQSTLDEEDNWKTEAIDLSTDEWAKRDFRDIYEAIEDLFDDIDEKEDIDRVVIRDEEVTSFNVDDEDSVVVQEIKVYYEDEDGDDVKVKLEIITEIEDGYVEEQNIDSL